MEILIQQIKLKVNWYTINNVEYTGHSEPSCCNSINVPLQYFDWIFFNKDVEVTNIQGLTKLNNKNSDFVVSDHTQITGKLP